MTGTENSKVGGSALLDRRTRDDRRTRGGRWHGAHRTEIPVTQAGVERRSGDRTKLGRRAGVGETRLWSDKALEARQNISSTCKPASSRPGGRPRFALGRLLRDLQELEGWVTLSRAQQNRTGARGSVPDAEPVASGDSVLVLPLSSGLKMPVTFLAAL